MGDDRVRGVTPLLLFILGVHLNLLTGEYKATSDDKGRILFPAKLRQSLGCDTLVVTAAFDKCLWFFTPSEWEDISSKLMAHSSPFSQKNRLVLRRFIAPAQEIPFDKAGRLAVPSSLREYASLQKDCIILGVNKYIELWDSKTYTQYLNDSDCDFQSATDELASLCF